jgi:hypothetical protein
MSDPVSEFLELEKTGQIPAPTGFMGNVGRQVAGNLSNVGTQVAAGVITAGVLWGGAKAIQAATQAVNRSRGYKAMLKLNPDLGERDQESVKGTYNMMYHAAPSLAMNPYVAGGFIRRTEHATKYVDPKMISDLASAEASIQKSRWGGFPDPMQMGMDMAGKAGTMALSREQFEWNKRHGKGGADSLAGAGGAGGAIQQSGGTNP